MKEYELQITFFQELDYISSCRCVDNYIVLTMRCTFQDYKEQSVKEGVNRGNQAGQRQPGVESDYNYVCICYMNFLKSSSSYIAYTNRLNQMQFC